MAQIAAADVAALRKATGAGMMDCKRALEASGGDMAQARDWLREQGLAGAAKRAGRAAEQGAVEVVVDGGVGVIVELTCETDFVAKSDDFADLLDALTRQVIEHGTEGIEAQALDADPSSTVGDAIKQLGAKVGENVALGRVVRFDGTEGVIDGYKHVQNDRGVIGVLVEVGGVRDDDARAREVAHELALHIASAAPRWLRRDDVPADVVDHERQVAENLTRNEGKPEQAIPKIVEGRMNGWYRENVLLEQAFVKDAKRSIAELVSELGPGAAIRRFARVKVGEE